MAKMEQPRFVITQSDRIKLMRGDILVKRCYNTEAQFMVRLVAGALKVSVLTLVVERMEKAA